MTIELTIEEQKKLKQLRNCLTSGNIMVGDIQSFLEGLERKISAPPDQGKKTRAKLKQQRKMKYRMMIMNNIHGNKKFFV